MDIKNLFNLGEETNQEKPKTQGEQFAEFLKGLNLEQSEKDEANSVHRAFVNKFGMEPEEFMKEGIDKHTEDLQLAILRAIKEASKNHGRKYTPMTLMYGLVGVLRHAYGEILETQLSEKDQHTLGVSSSMRAIAIHEMLESDNVNEGMENVMAGLAFLMVNLGQLSIEEEGRRAHKEQSR